MILLTSCFTAPGNCISDPLADTLARECSQDKSLPFSPHHLFHLLSDIHANALRMFLCIHVLGSTDEHCFTTEGIFDPLAGIVTYSTYYLTYSTYYLTYTEIFDMQLLRQRIAPALPPPSTSSPGIIL